MTVYYNEYDKKTAAWLRELIREGVIAPGVVDDRSIEDVRPNDLAGFTQCHFFAGIGVWSFALRAAGWPDDRPIWTGSCPCQPFSAAGEGAGFADERHLWPAFLHLIGERRPAKVLGEQVASKDADPWIDLVQDDLEGLGYRVGAVPFPSAGVGAPHIRDRLYWAASRRLDHSDQPRLEGHGHGHQAPEGWERTIRPAAETGEPCRLAHPDGGHAGAERQQPSGEQRQQPQDGGHGVVALGGLADPSSERRNRRIVCLRADAGERAPGDVSETGRSGSAVLGAGNAADTGDVGPLQATSSPGPTNGYWRDADWLGCRDGKWRPVEPGTFPLVDGAPARVLRLRGYGNAINAQAAQAWCEIVMECMP